MKHLLPILAVWLVPLVSLTATNKPKPNIIYILADDLGYGNVQCLNPQRGKIKTPSLDRLASQGITFTDAHGGSRSARARSKPTMCQFKSVKRPARPQKNNPIQAH